MNTNLSIGIHLTHQSRGTDNTSQCSASCSAPPVGYGDSIPTPLVLNRPNPLRFSTMYSNSSGSGCSRPWYPGPEPPHPPSGCKGERFPFPVEPEPGTPVFPFLAGAYGASRLLLIVATLSTYGYMDTLFYKGSFPKRPLYIRILYIRISLRDIRYKIDDI